MEELEKAKLLSVATKLAQAQIQEVREELLEQINSIHIPEAVNGLDGRSIVNARIFEGQLVLQLSDGVLVTAGSVIGEQGPVGPVGAKGDKGDKGDPGPRGDKGDHGVPGLDGKEGEKGEKGETGPNGEKGDTGERGERGEQGIPGQRGQRGERGEQGSPGINGADGRDGTDGKEGSKGDVGSPGRDGPQGPIGPKGDKGEKGDKGDSGSDANTKDLEKKFDSLIENVDKRFSRFAYSAAAGVKHSGSGEVWLHRLDDFDYNSTKTPTQGQALIWNNRIKKWQANSVSGTGGSITVSKILTNGSYANIVTGVTGLRFDDDSGFDVVDLGNGDVKVQMNSTFKYWNVNGSPGLTAVGLDTANFIAGSGIIISANPSNNSITFTSTGGGATANLSSYLQVSNANAKFATKTYAASNSYVKQILANTNLYVNNVSNRERTALANTNEYIATRAPWSALTSTNTALRLYVNSQVAAVVNSAPGVLDTLRELANALANDANYAVHTASLIATKQSVANAKIWLANTNSYIANKASWSALTTTNTALRGLISDRLQVANAEARYTTKAYAAANSYVNQILANTNSYIATKITNAISTTIRTRSIIPETNITYNIGSATKRYNKLWLAGNTIILGVANLSVSDSGNLIITGPSGSGQIIATNPAMAAIYISNTAARSLISDRLQVANANAKFATKAYAAANSYVKSVLANTNLYIATKASWTELKGTNTALRLLINDRIQVANVDAKYTTKAYAASNAYVKLLLANTNAYIADVAATVGSGGGGGGYSADVFDYGSIATAIDVELNRDYGTL